LIKTFWHSRHKDALQYVSLLKNPNANIQYNSQFGEKVA